MNSFWPVIVIEGYLAFGGVLFLYWWSMRHIKKWKERRKKDNYLKKK